MSVCNILNANGANKGKIGSQFLPDLTPIEYGFYEEATYVNVYSDDATELYVASDPANLGVYANYGNNVGSAISTIRFGSVLNPLPPPGISKFKVNFTVEFKNLQINTRYIGNIEVGQILITRVPIYIWPTVTGLTFEQYTPANPYLAFIELVVPDPTSFPLADELVFINVNQQIQFTDYCDAVAGVTNFFGVDFKFGCPFGINDLANYQLSAVNDVRTQGLLGVPSAKMNMAVSLTIMNI